MEDEKKTLQRKTQSGSQAMTEVTTLSQQAEDVLINCN